MPYLHHRVLKLCDKLVGKDYNTSILDPEQQDQHDCWISLCNTIKENDTLGVVHRGHFCNASGSDSDFEAFEATSTTLWELIWNWLNTKGNNSSMPIFNIQNSSTSTYLRELERQDHPEVESFCNHDFKDCSVWKKMEILCYRSKPPLPTLTRLKDLSLSSRKKT